MKALFFSFALVLVAWYVDKLQFQSSKETAVALIVALQPVGSAPAWTSQVLRLAAQFSASLAFLTYSREAGFLAFTAGQIGILSVVPLKLVFQSPRPFWEDSRVDTLDCPGDYGSPSAVAACAGAVLLVLAVYGLASRKCIVGKLVGVLFGLLFIVGLQAWTGTEYFMQTVFGLAIAQFLAVVITNQSVKEAVYMTRESTLVALIAVAGLVTVYGITCILFLSHSTQYSEQWKDQFYTHCNGGLVEQHAMLLSLAEAAASFFLCGFIIGYRSSLPKRLPPHTTKPLVFSLVALVALFSFMEIVDSTILSTIPSYFNLVVLAVHKFTCGLIVTFLLPQLLSTSEGGYLTPATELARIPDLS